jgi:hypothetical protein
MINYLSALHGQQLDAAVIPFVLILAVAIYFIPTAIAALNKHPQLLGIGIVNLFLGWTLIGLLAVLIWAFVKPSPPVILIQNPSPPPIPRPPQRPTIEDELSSIVRLKDARIITEAEYTARRARILDSVN